MYSRRPFHELLSTGLTGPNVRVFRKRVTSGVTSSGRRIAAATVVGVNRATAASRFRFKEQRLGIPVLVTSPHYDFPPHLPTPKQSSSVGTASRADVGAQMRPPIAYASSVLSKDNLFLSWKPPGVSISAVVSNSAALHRRRVFQLTYSSAQLEQRLQSVLNLGRSGQL